MAMYYLTNGKEYVAENELIPGEYIKTTYTVKAKKFTYKEGMTFKKKRWKKDKDFKKYKLINVETGEMVNPNYMGNSGAYIGDHNFDFDDGILDKIIHEADLIKSMAAWDEKQLKEYKTVLTNELSKKDSIISDIYHALLEYGDTHNGKRPQAHKIAKISYMFNTKIQACKHNHAFYGSTCPVCGEPVETEFTRIVGFYTPVKTYSKERKAEFAMREWGDINAEVEAI